MKKTKQNMRADAHEVLEIADAICHSCNTLLRALRHDDHAEYHYDVLRDEVMRMIAFEFDVTRREEYAEHART